MDDYVTKPIQMEQIIQILTQYSHNSFSSVNPTPSVMVETLDRQILDWSMSVQLAAQKEDLARDLLGMLLDSFDAEINEIQQLIELEDYPQLEHVLHRLYGATRYVGVPKLQTVTGEFEQFVSTLRKQQRKADDAFIDEVNTRFEQLNVVIAEVRVAAQSMLGRSSNTD